MKNKINFGIIGLGKIANKFANALLNVADAKLYAVASNTPQNLKDFCQKFNVNKAYSTYEDLVKDNEIDVIYISTTHNFHYENIKLALNHNKNVICEKPITISSLQLKELTELAKSKNLFLMEALWTRFLPSIDNLKEIIISRNIGEIKYIHSNFGFKTIYNPEGRLFNPKLAGGSLFDIGIYPIFLSYYLLGKPKKIMALGQFAPSKVDTQCSIILEYENGAIANLFCTILAETDCTSWIHGTEASIKIEPRWHEPPARVNIYQKRKLIEKITNKTFTNGMEYEIEEVVKCIKNKKIESQKWSLADSMEIQIIIEKILNKIKE